jgi:hypothetical protein
MELTEGRRRRKTQRADDRLPIWFLTCGRDIVILGVAGDLVGTLSEQFERALESLRAREAEHVVVDLRRVTSIGADALSAVGRFARSSSDGPLWLAASGPAFEIVDPPPVGATVVRTPHEAVRVIRAQRKQARDVSRRFGRGLSSLTG